jgi:heme-degrading monooxygenase HmoA
MAVQVFFIAKIKNFNDEYREYSSQLRTMANSHPGFVSIESDVIDDIEITVSTWVDADAVKDWAHNKLHREAKQKSSEWYEWVKGIHVETTL